MKKTNRRTFIKAAGTSTAAALGGAYAQDGPDVPMLPGPPATLGGRSTSSSTTPTSRDRARLTR